MSQALVIFAYLSLSAGTLVAEYEFQSDTKPNVAVFRGDTFSIGKLDAAGNFLPDPKYVNINGRAWFSGPPCTLMNSPKGGAYEYRSGRLIQGRLEDKGNFIPDLDSKVISLDRYLKEYQPGKSLRISNLPGKIVRKGSKDEKKK